MSGRVVAVTRVKRGGKAYLRTRYKKKKKKAGDAPLPQKTYMAKADIGKSIGFPKSKLVTLKYLDSVALTNTAGALVAYQFLANGLQDPNISGGGHQPFGFDQWAGFYNKYRVMRSRLKVTLTPSIIVTSVPLIAGVYLSDDTTVYSDYGGMIESGRGEYAIMPADTNNQRTMYLDFDATKFFTNQIDKGDTSSDVTNNPANQAIMTVWSGAALSTASSHSYNAVVEIDYHVLFFEPKDLVTS